MVGKYPIKAHRNNFLSYLSYISNFVYQVLVSHYGSLPDSRPRFYNNVHISYI